MLRPFYGLKGAWHTQHMRVAFSNVEGLVLSPNARMRNTMENWGIGIRAGMDTSWHFTRSFSLVGNMAFTCLWEEFKVKRFDVAEAGGFSESNVNLKKKVYDVEPVIELALGLKWETGMACDASHFSITAAWEEQVWFDQNQFLRILP